MRVSTLARKSYREVVLFSVFTVIVAAETVSAQQSELTGDIIEQGWFQRLPPPVRSLADSALEHYKNFAFQKSIPALETLLAMGEVKKSRRLFRAWIHQWLALNYFALHSLERDSLERAKILALAKNHVQYSLEADTDIWSDYDNIRLPQEVRLIYQNDWAKILDRFFQKRRSLRLGVGTITKVDYGHRYDFFNITLGVGTTVVLFEEIRNLLEENVDYRTKFFNDLLISIRVERMRKYIKRLTAGVYLEFAFLEDFKEEKIHPAKALSSGPLLSYAYKSGWEIGGSFEVLRLIMGRGKTKFSQTAFGKDENFSLSYTNFELYIRRWF
jgi:hypothetical protein